MNEDKVNKDIKKYFIILMVELGIIGLYYYVDKQMPHNDRNTYCDNAINCECKEDICNCEYCVDDDCLETTSIVCPN